MQDIINLGKYSEIVAVFRQCFSQETKKPSSLWLPVCFCTSQIQQKQMYIEIYCFLAVTYSPVHVDHIMIFKNLNYIIFMASFWLVIIS